MSNDRRDLCGIPLDGQPRVEVLRVSAQGTPYATSHPHRSSQPPAAAMPHRFLPELPWPTVIAGPVGFLGVVGGSWAGPATPDCVANTDTNMPGCWVIGQFGQREGVACVAGSLGKVEKSGVVWHGLAASAHRVSDKKLNAIPPKSLEVWQFPKREGAVCVGGAISQERAAQERRT